MRELGIKSRMQKRYRKPKTVVTVDQKPNLIRHLHDLSGFWQTDITYIQLTNHIWVYLTTVLDPEKIKVLGYKIGGDGSLLPEPVKFTHLMLTCAERAEVIVDFGQYHEGDEVT